MVIKEFCHYWRYSFTAAITTVVAGLQRRFYRVGQRAGVPHAQSMPVLMFSNAYDLGHGHEGVCVQSVAKKLGVQGRSMLGMLALVRAPCRFLGLSVRGCRGPQTPACSRRLVASVAESRRKGKGSDAASIPVTAASADIPNA